MTTVRMSFFFLLFSLYGISFYDGEELQVVKRRFLFYLFI